MKELSHHDHSRFLSIEKEIRKVHINRVDETLNQKDRLCSTLRGLLVDNIHCRLDRIYLETISDSQHNHVAVSNHDDELEAEFASELQTLADEIVPVVEMFVEHDYAAPLKAATTKRCFLQETEATIILDKVSGLLTFSFPAHGNRPQP